MNRVEGCAKSAFASSSAGAGAALRARGDDPRGARVHVAESGRACSYTLSKQVQETCQFWLLTFWLLTVPSPSI